MAFAETVRTLSFVVFFVAGIAFSASSAQAHHDKTNPLNQHAKQEETCSRCDGNTPCNACTNCSRCKWCNSGGTCGVCAPSTGGGSSRGTGRASSSSPSSTYTTPAPTPRPKPTPALHAMTPQKTVIVVPEVGLRKTAKDDSKRLRLLHKGDAVTVLGAEAGRYKIMLGDGGKGFVPKRAVGWVPAL